MITVLLNEFNLKLNHGYGKIGDRPIRYLEDEGLFQIGETMKTFDRWANSVEYDFEVFKASGIRCLRKWLSENISQNK